MSEEKRNKIKDLEKARDLSPKDSIQYEAINIWIKKVEKDQVINVQVVNNIFKKVVDRRNNKETEKLISK
jgi:hypothetical protein